MSNRSIIIGAAIALLAIGLVGLIDTIPDMERELEQRTAENLDELSIEYEDIDFSGRIGTVRVAAGSEQAVEATIREELNTSFFSDVFRLDVEGGDTSVVAEPPIATSSTTTSPRTTTSPPTTAVPVTTTPSATTPAENVAAEIVAVTSLQAITFDSGTARITAEGQDTLDEIAEALGANPEIDVVVEGHTDSNGGQSANMALSQARASAVVDYLVTKDIAADRLEAIGFGESAPIADNNTADGRAKNRRIEFDVTNGSN